MARQKDYSKAITTRYALDLRARAISGDKAAYEEMVERNKALAKKANRRLSALEKAGFTRYAYDRAISYTESEYGMKRFTTDLNKLKDIPDLQINLQEMSKFIDSKASTVSGNKRIDLNIVNSFRDKGITIPKGSENEFIDLIKSDEFQTLKKTYVDSDVLVSDLVDLTDNYGVSISDIAEAFDKIVHEDVTYDVALEELGKKI